MNHDSFRSVVCRSLSKSLPSRSKEQSYPGKTECAAPYVVTLQPTVCRRCESQDWSPAQSNWEERSILSQRDYAMASSLSRHFAEDLLRGAMDLQESLVMLEKFQTVSRSIRQSNKNRRPETGERSLDVTGIHEALFEASIAKKVLPGSVSNRFDGQFRNSTDELKRVIKDSLYRTNDEQASLSQSARYTRNSPVVSESTKQKKVAPRSLSCTPVQPERSKSPSLVARLMGLEGLPLHKGITAKKDETLKTVSSPRAQFDIEMPKSKTPASEKLPKQLFGKDSDHNRKAGQEIMKTIQIKRVLKTTTSDEHKVKQQNVRMNYPYSRRDSLPSQDTSAVTELGSVKSMKREQRTVQARTKAPEHVKIVPHVTRNQHIKQVETNRRSSNTQKHHLTDRRGEGRKDTKAEAASASRTNSKLVKNHDKKLISPSSSPSSCRAMKPVLRRTPGNSRASTASSRNVRNSIIDDIVAYEVHREFIETDGASTEHSATPSDECQSAGWDTDPSIDDIREDFSGSNEASSSSSPVERTISTDDNPFHPPIERALIKEAEIKDEMSLLLLSDKSFLTRAAQLVGIHTYDHLIEQYQGTPKAEVKDRQLYVDIAAEQLEQKHRQQSSPCGTGFRNQKCRTATYFSLVALMGDISTGTQKLNSYTDDESYGSGSKDSLSVKLERDLGCLEPSINSVWDMGWHDWMCMEETEFWARDAGEIVLSTLIEEVALEMLGW
ncbi:uncharacterized protein LOC124662809 [Lolium rigidum]|uniref:uncharacterized protein LOC124662809 n=1 Tax=Lolium rigidum TaxID=89674 RepID=UPI001F5C24D7|nr:uncharacterized protein LOC124662809 [Lolium rigidum]XP_047056559.1 uncharacterized protein LOC124662809 [Lolium rigidum]